jgi:cytochrome c oxidase subunit III
MTPTLLFLGVLAVLAGLWLRRAGLATRPWLETGVAAETAPLPAAKLGLYASMAVAAMLMLLLLSAQGMRAEMADWSPPPRPLLLYANTGLLVLASLALLRATQAARRGRRDDAAFALRAGGLAGVAFVAGQLLAWRELSAAGYRLSGNPADSFFYLITAVHGLHLLGGLVALGHAEAKLRRRVPMERLAPGIALSATYWHFLLVAWLVLFAALGFAPSLDWLVALCAAPFR